MDNNLHIYYFHGLYLDFITTVIIYLFHYFRLHRLPTGIISAIYHFTCFDRLEFPLPTLGAAPNRFHLLDHLLSRLRQLNV